ncbi:hypothetical protein AVEN_57302-1 [Araneus ventricosus]|uniref:Uncharacterized protein n=1 Tax=Araneus ventricosus TaxID=182803 RepID=A0A4Y2IS32_ARAVE|nr:hypothetical protein AVEN_57302-1 [Araneus ventricosus]
MTGLFLTVWYEYPLDTNQKLMKSLPARTKAAMFLRRLEFGGEFSGEIASVGSETRDEKHKCAAFNIRRKTDDLTKTNQTKIYRCEIFQIYDVLNQYGVDNNGSDRCENKAFVLVERTPKM